MEAFKIGDHVHAMLIDRTYCGGTVEVIAERIGVRLVNGNFRWCEVDKVRHAEACS